ncbi:hypothetical protein MMC21_005051 [Puttea exsequens]|nr:hypothetical protein [Puttea exsequens]
MPNGHTTNKTINGRDQCQDPVQPRYENKRSSHASVSGSLYNTSSNPGFNRFPEFQRPTPSANSWASDSHGNSLTSFDPPLSALLPPHWPHHQLVNSVPSPPANQNDFQRAGSVTATLNQLEMTLHHHIDSSFASLSRLVTDHHERAMDQILRRLDKLEDIVGKGFRNMKTEVKDVRKEVGSHSAEIRYISRGNDRAKELMEELDHKLQKTQEYMDDYICKCHMSTPEHSSSEPENNRIRQAATHRRTESANGVLGSGTPGKRYQNRVNRSSTSARRSDTSNTRYRSNTLDSQADKSTSDEKSMRREYFAELGATRGPVPDLREHPAYASIPQNPPTRFEQELNAKKNGQPYDSPSLSDGRWYQQAYGQPL